MLTGRQTETGRDCHTDRQLDSIETVWREVCLTQKQMWLEKLKFLADKANHQR